MGIYFFSLMLHWGRGTQDIVSACLNAGHPELQFIASRSSVMVKMYSKHPMSTSFSGESAKLKYQLTARQQEIFDLLAQNKDGLSSAQIANRLGQSVNERTIRRDLGEMKILSLVLEYGKGRNLLWRLKSSEVNPDI